MIEKFDIDKSSWTPVRFGDVVKEPKESVKDPVAAGIEHVVGLEHIDAESIHLRRSASIEESTTFTKKFSQGDVLFGRRRAYLKKAAQATFEGICSGDITVMRAKDGLMPELLPFIIQNDKFFDYAIEHSAGGLSPRVKFKDLANYEFLLPPKEQQAELAELLWSMDEVIEKELIVSKQLERQLGACEKDFFVDQDNLVKLSAVIESSFSGGTPSTKNSSFYEKGTIPWVTTKILNDDFISIGENLITQSAIEKSAAKLLPAGNIVAGTRVGVGKFSINEIDISFSQDVSGLVVDTQKVDLEFLVYQLNSFVIQNRIMPFARGTTIKGITKDDLLNTKVSLPDKDEQLKKRTALKIIKESLKEIVKKNSTSKQLQKSLINQVF